MMPELPEVETIRRGLNAAIINKQIADVQVLVQRSFPTFNAAIKESLIGSKIHDIKRQGKLLIICLNNKHCLAIHLRMTGQLVFRATSGTKPNDANGKSESGNTDNSDGNDCCDNSFGGGYPSASLVRQLPDKSTRVIFDFLDKSHLFFNDQRKFGYLKYMLISDLASDEFIRRLGPEPLDDNFTWETFRDSLPLASKRPIKAVLLDQSVIAGVGNIYADESLFAAGINPARAVALLNKKDIKRLAESIVCCMRQSIADGGSTMRNYVDGLGQRGEYLDLHAQVFNRAGSPCARCGRAIEKTRVAGRGTHWCPNCQR
ncbi:MAG: bifunctional DNA-formamidopyrimidine glycosylase/DNA-(apurinic or apyrimidinic site) lyase [Coriobacteriales bacterium]|jgi:formamidopyrimidine-DNA glycosylase|nr:bifunctional DNA-formamidopyrimidine glycosylase/DNA-(apurinic or apyrimidinic site) lyase [Coriobacteriales bacterium]